MKYVVLVIFVLLLSASQCLIKDVKQNPTIVPPPPTPTLDYS